MSEWIVKEDYLKCIIYTVVNCILSAIFMVITSISLVTNHYFVTFIAITILWFTIKYMIKYGKFLMKRNPICIFKKNGIQVYPDDVFITYKEIIEVQVVKKTFTVQLWIKSLNVEHPTKYLYVGITYLFERKKLAMIYDTIVELLKNKGIKTIER